ncbi:MAG: flavin monoamine oxidase family protein [Halobacteriales archaeon]|nr:flavin monoamine oxidase family protein [Halobacteriales archaeon]
MTEAVETKVAVVGAGLAGLETARQLHDRNMDVRVLEARDRVGGRTLSQELDGDMIDLGAQWIGPGQELVKEVIDEFGIKTFGQHVDGVSKFRAGGKVGSHNEVVMALSQEAQNELFAAVGKIESQSSEVPTDAPYDAPKAEEWDSMTAATWRDSEISTQEARDAFDAAVRSVFASEPAELSWLYFLFYVRAGGGFLSLTSVEGGAQQTRIEGGAQKISEAMAEELEGRVHLETPVSAIKQDDEGVTVESDGMCVEADYAVVAVPPTVAGRIRYEPPMPARRDGLTQRTPMGSVTKCIASYEEPFWREEGLSGEVVDAEGPVGLIMDDSPSDGSSGALVGFLLGDDGRALADIEEEERRDTVLESFADYFGEEALEPVEYVDHVWAKEPYSGGCYAGTAAPGTLTRYGEALREPVGRIHWAGTETAKEWTGYMDGALRSGRRAVVEVVERIE